MLEGIGQSIIYNKNASARLDELIVGLSRCQNVQTRAFHIALRARLSFLFCYTTTSYIDELYRQLLRRVVEAESAPGAHFLHFQPIYTQRCPVVPCRGLVNIFNTILPRFNTTRCTKWTQWIEMSIIYYNQYLIANHFDPQAMWQCGLFSISSFWLWEKLWSPYRKSKVKILWDFYVSWLWGTFHVCKVNFSFRISEIFLGSVHNLLFKLCKVPIWFNSIFFTPWSILSRSIPLSPNYSTPRNMVN